MRGCIVPAYMAVTEMVKEVKVGEQNLVLNCSAFGNQPVTFDWKFISATHMVQIGSSPPSARRAWFPLSDNFQAGRVSLLASKQLTGLAFFLSFFSFFLSFLLPFQILPFLCAFP